MFMKMIIGMFFAWGLVKRIWHRSVSTFITTNMLFAFVVIRELNITYAEELSYAVIVVGLLVLHYRAIFKEGNDKWSFRPINIQLWKVK